ncbi:MAG: DUF3999 domain-containing protein [Treponema sp.]|jgi:hypothetical protein|nr:DUF3999 domain-containing protein [Treponema sp.]
MSVKGKAAAWIILLFCAAQAPCGTEDEKKNPGPEDFAGAIEYTGPGGSLLVLEIPGAVYRGLERPDRGDIRVFDAEGLPVPFLIRPAPGIRITPESEDVPFFVWQEGRDRSLPERTDIEIDSSGTVVRIRGQTAAESRGGRDYLLDLSGLPHKPASLSFSLGRTDEFFNTPVQVYSSDDLSQWQAQEKRQVFAWYGEGGVSRSLVDPGNEKSRYLLLKFETRDPAPERITAHFEAVEIPALAEEEGIGGTLGAERRIALYDMGAFYPLVRIEWRLPEPDSVDVIIRNRFFEWEEWGYRGRQRLYRYRLEDGGERKNGPLEVSGGAPRWQLEAAGDIPFTSAPVCYPSREIQELVFLARGRGPWTLAYGNREFGPPSGTGIPADAAGMEAAGTAIAPAVPSGVMRYEKRASPAEPERHWGQWFLWAILILSVMVLSFLAFMLARSMRHPASPSGPGNSSP